MSSELDLDVDVSREVEAHERVHGLRRRVDDVDQPLVRPHLEMVTAVLVLVRRTDDAEHVLLSWQRHRAHDRRTSAAHRVDDLARRAVDDLVVVGLEPDADLLSRHGVVCLSLSEPLRTDPRARACRDFLTLPTAVHHCWCWSEDDFRVFTASPRRASRTRTTGMATGPRSSPDVQVESST